VSLSGFSSVIGCGIMGDKVKRECAVKPESGANAAIVGLHAAPHLT
jgi:hypothetical protein